MSEELKHPTSMGFGENTEELLCYVPILGVLPAMAFVVLEKNKNVRWYAVQAVLLWLTVVAADMILGIGGIFYQLTSLVNIIGLVIIPLFVAIKINQKESVKLPFLTQLTDKLMTYVK
jgi:uncharacterized membrane protein